jgi:hypothetical protein
VEWLKVIGPGFKPSTIKKKQVGNLAQWYTNTLNTEKKKKSVLFFLGYGGFLCFVFFFSDLPDFYPRSHRVPRWVRLKENSPNQDLPSP